MCSPALCHKYDSAWDFYNLSVSRNAPRSTSHCPLLSKMLQHFRGEQEHATSPVLVVVMCWFPEQSYWEHTGILKSQISASVPFGGGTLLFGHKPTCLAELKDIISLLCKYGLVLWASGGWDLPVSCSCLLFHRAVPTLKSTGSFFFTHIFLVLLSLCKRFEQIFPLWHFSKCQASTLKQFRLDDRTRLREKSCLLFLMDCFCPSFSC